MDQLKESLKKNGVTLSLDKVGGAAVVAGDCNGWL